MLPSQGRPFQDERSWVVLDARMILHTGVGTYIRTLFPHLPALERHPYLTLTNRGLPVVSPWPSRQVRAAPLGLSNHLLAGELRNVRAALLHVPYFNVPATWPGPTVITIHDLIPLLFPETIRPAARRLAYRLWLSVAVRRTKAVVTVSECSRTDIIRLLRVPADRVVVVPPAAPLQFRPDPSGEARARVQGRVGTGEYFLCVGRAKPYKNLSRLLGAFRRVHAGRTTLVLVGLEPDAVLAKEVDALAIRGAVHVVGHVSEDDLAAFYQAATAVVIPSLYEGFGLPALEGMACGAPVIASNRGALPEVVGDAAILVNPEDEQAIANAMTRILDDRALRAELRRRGLVRAQAFSARASAGKLAEVYRGVLATRLT